MPLVPPQLFHLFASDDTILRALLSDSHIRFPAPPPPIAESPVRHIRTGRHTTIIPRESVRAATER